MTTHCPNYYEEMDDHLVVYTNGDKTFLIDKDDRWALEIGIRWLVNGSGYVLAWSSQHKSIKIARLIMKDKITKQKKVVDHISGDKLDNRKKNLRVCTMSQNQQNRKPRKNSSSKYKNVSWSKRRNTDKKWCVTIRAGGKYVHVGYYNNELYAACVADDAMMNEHKDFARPNYKQCEVLRLYRELIYQPDK